MNKEFSNVEIKIISAVVPRDKLELKSLAKIYGKDTVDKIIKSTGITEVRVAPEGITSSDLCIIAAQRMFEETGLDSNCIDGVVFVTQTPDYKVPNTSGIIQNKLNIKKDSIAFDINYGCSGYVYGLFQSYLLVESGYCNNVLLCVGDTTTKYINEHDRSNRMMAGDAGSVSLISRKSGASKSVFNFYTDGSGAEFLIVPAGGCRMSAQKGVTDILEFDSDGNGTTLENLRMNGLEITTFALSVVKRQIKNIIDNAGWNINDVKLFAIHQANEFIVKQIARQLKVDKTLVPVGIQKTGNSAATTIPVMLSNLYPGINCDLDKVVVCGFGVGLSCATGVIDLSNTKILTLKEI